MAVKTTSPGSGGVIAESLAGAVSERKSSRVRYWGSSVLVRWTVRRGSGGIEGQDDLSGPSLDRFVAAGHLVEGQYLIDGDDQVSGAVALGDLGQ